MDRHDRRALARDKEIRIRDKRIAELTADLQKWRAIADKFKAELYEEMAKRYEQSKECAEWREEFMLLADEVKPEQQVLTELEGD